MPSGSTTIYGTFYTATTATNGLPRLATHFTILYRPDYLITDITNNENI